VLERDPKQLAYVHHQQVDSFVWSESLGWMLTGTLGVLLRRTRFG